jgi:uncharacterized membrane protein
MNRMTVWRSRLDITSNWAIILTTGLTTFTLGSVEVPHYVLLLGLALFGISILIEGRRYRHLHHSKWRLYLIEFGHFSSMLNPSPHHEGVDWRSLLAADLRHAHFPITWLTAIRSRLRRNYLMLLYFITAVWLAKLFIHPARPESVQEFYFRLAVGDLVPSWFVAVTAVIFVAGATVMALTCPPAEQLENWSAHYSRVAKRHSAQRTA